MVGVSISGVAGCSMVAYTGLHYLHKLQGIIHCSVSSYSILLSTRGAKVGWAGE